MSNIILDDLPKSLDGLSINSDFRVAILFELLMQDRSVNDIEKLQLALNLFYNDEIKDFNSAFKNIVWFYSCGQEVRNTNSKTKQIYSFEHDSDYIFSAFLSQYNIDLNSIKYMHWWKFRALFSGLDEDHLFSKIMGYRAMDLSKIKDKEQRKYYKKLKIRYRLPDNRTEEEKEQDFANMLG